MDDANSGITRRELGALVAGAWAAAPAQLAEQAPRNITSPGPVLDIAEWGYYWYGVEHATLARGTMCNGKQMYVEHWIPAQVRHPYPVVPDPRRLRAGFRLDQHARWPPRLGLTVSGAGIQSICARSAGAGPQPLSPVGAWAV